MEVLGGPAPSALEALGRPAYVGNAQVQLLSTSFGDGLEVRFVQLEPGARSRPHVSASGCLIHMVAGEAVVANEHDRVVVGRGETVTVAAGEWHWHGGLPHVAAVLLVVDRPGEVSWNVPERDWAVGYDPPAAAGEEHET
jgi:quercetin dioxygenase-like cupin family protein